ncbi:SET domain-containing protein-lysine N-methyltransferase [Candidatus Woesearchaeota archaeon]|nr:SET domain-containing protein-lysine N-methyltransferase [Candidatus Woesearchaeota archaeon]
MTVHIKTIKGKGRGGFAGKDFKKGEIIELAPVIVLSPKDRTIIEKSKLDDYYFEWGKDNKAAAIVMGYGSLYNHSSTPNAHFIQNFKKKQIKYRCIKNIKKGDEITINYYGKVNDKRSVWFELKCKRSEWQKNA